MVKAEKIIAMDAEYDLVQREDGGLHLFEKADVVSRPASKPAFKKDSVILINDLANGVQLILKNGKLVLLED